jgi:DNA mismatch repair protein PMS2
MRHLCGLSVWDELGWKEGLEPDGENPRSTDWTTYVRLNRGDPGTPALLDDEETLVGGEEIED